MIHLGPLHLPGFENRMVDSPIYYLWAPAQLERQETTYVPFCYNNGKSAVFKTLKFFENNRQKSNSHW